MSNEESKEKSNGLNPGKSNLEGKKPDVDLDSRQLKARFESPEWFLPQFALDFVLDGEYEKAKRFAEGGRKIENMKFSGQGNDIREEVDKFKKSFEEAENKMKSANQAEQVLSGQQNPETVKMMTPDQRVNLRGQEVGKQLSQDEITQFLIHVYRGNLENVEEFLMVNKTFASAQGNIKDLSDRTFKQITAFQYACWAMDVEMWELIFKYLPIYVARDQLNALVQERPDIIKAYGLHFSWNKYQLALKKYTGNYRSWKESYDEGGKLSIATCWCEEVGAAQREFPAWMIMLMSEEGRGTAWGEMNLELGFKRHRKYLEGWFIHNKTHHLGAKRSPGNWDDVNCGFGWARGAGSQFDVWQ